MEPPKNAPALDIGSTALDLVVALAHMFDVTTAFEFIQYKPTLPLAQRSGSASAAYRVTLSGDGTPQAPIWIPDYQVLYAERLARGEVPHDLLRKAAVHRIDSAHRIRSVVERSGITHDALMRLRSERSDMALAISSRVQTRHGQRHLPLIDFQCPVGDLFREVLAAGLVAINCSGYLLESGASYHFYGNRLLTDQAWREFMGFTLLLMPFVDARYVGHRLIDGESVLRISTDPAKTTMPRIVSHIGRADSV